MFGRLLRLFFGDRDAVYRYHDGRYWRKADPLVIARELESLCPEYQTYLDLLVEERIPVPGSVGDDLERQRKEALQKLVEVSRKVFAISALKDYGRTDAGVFSVLVKWLIEMHAMGESARPFVNSRQRDAPSTSPDYQNE